MGGHGGLNILPQKRWNVYNFDNREKVRKDEEAAARDEQLQRDETRKRDAQLRLDRLRTSRGLAPLKRPSPEAQNGKEEKVPTEPEESEPKSGHINLFQGIKIFDVIQVPKNEEPAEEEDKSRKKMRKEAAAAARAAAREAEGRELSADDEKYRLGYGVAGKGVKLPWYLERRKGEDVDEDAGEGWRGRGGDERKKKSGKKSVQELREERLKREKREKERERAVLMELSRKSGGFSRRRGD